jgi:hypothetical protein
MSQLSPELRQLVLAGKRAGLPTEADSARVLETLRARLCDAAVVGAGTAQVAARFASSGLAQVSAISLAGLALLGGFLFVTARNHRAASGGSILAPSEAATSTFVVLASGAATPGAPASPEPQANGTLTASKPTADRVEARPVASHHAKDKLAEEVALLSRAEAALHSGKPMVALEVLNEHEHKFRDGLLAEERTAARVQALCALGRTAEADTQLARLSPKSLHGAQSRQACSSRRSN